VATGRDYALATPHALATDAGERAFKAGGTAVDAALAAAAVLTVVYPHMCAIGGDLFALLCAPGRPAVAVNGSGPAPARIDPDVLRARGPVMPVAGPETITVPGMVRAWETLMALDGRLPLRDILAPAIAYARDGVPVAPSLARGISELAEELVADAGMSALLFDDGGPLGTGAPLRQPALARSLEAIAEGGAEVLYSGALGETLVRGLQRAGSPLAMDDLARHRTELQEPLSHDYRGLEIVTTPPNSQGFVLLEILSALAELDALPDPLGPDAALLAHVFRLASADRDDVLADPRCGPVLVDALLAPEHAAELLRKARARLDSPVAARAATGPSGDTVAVVAADSDGHAVSLIQSVFRSFGSGILEPETGIVCHSRGSFFSLDPSSPNVLEGKKRPAHTLMPVMTRREGRLTGVHGAMGGKAQPQIHAHLLLRLLGGATPADALAAPRWVAGGLDVDSADDVILLERSAGPESADAFDAAGMPVELLDDLDEGVGHAQLIWRGPDGTLEAATDPRADGAAAAGQR
jgi:gamma-glutamyltranspeptidase/glutathione hydrolase